MSVVVILTPQEIRMAALIGVERRIESLGSHRAGAAGRAASASGPGWDIDIEGACAELACAKALRLYWPGTVGSFHEPDIPPDVQVRWTAHEDGKLIVRADDDNTHKFVLVIGIAPRYHIAGWIYGADAKQAGWAQAPNGRPAAFFVPQADLRAFNTRRRNP